MEKRKTVRALTESAIMVALATVFSLVKLIDLPYGGSVTLASMLPIIIISYRYGIAWGLGSGLVFSGTQALLGLKNFSYVTTWQSILAVLFLDYIIAFTVAGLGGAFRKGHASQAISLSGGAVLACILRYICHVISGATVWAGLSIPSAAALSYSLIYNATYMIPETIVTVLLALYLGSTIDFRADHPTRLVTQKKESAYRWIPVVNGLLIIGTAIFDTLCIFNHLQNSETGEFDITGIVNVNWVLIGIVTGIVAVCVAILFIVNRRKVVSVINGLLAIGAIIFDAEYISSHLLNAETGKPDINALSSVNWILPGIVTGVVVIAIIVLSIISRKKKK